MKRNPHTVLVLVATALACDPLSRNVGDLQPGGGESIDLVAAADAICQSQEDCCPLDLEATGLWFPDLCRGQTRDSLQAQAERAADLGLQADPACFDALAECGPTDAEAALECQPPCKLFFGTKGLDEPCDGDSQLDDCGQGLVCGWFAYHEWTCLDDTARCGSHESRCVDPCATQTDIECRALDWPSLCGPDAFCDDPFAIDDEVPGTCRARAAIGSPCDPSLDSCLPGAFCDGAAPGGPTCIATLVDGTPCGGDYQCASRRCGASDDPDVQVGVCEATLAAECG